MARRVTGPMTPSAATPSARWRAIVPDALATCPLRAAGPSAATAPPATRVMHASSAAPPPRPARRRRACRAASARRRREALSDASHGLGFAGSMKGTAHLLGLVPTGLAVGLALRPALRHRG